MPPELSPSQAISTFQVEDFLAYTIGIIVYFVGLKMNERIAFFRNFHIPAPVTGGLLAALAALGIYLIFGLELAYDLSTRDRLLVYFFTTIGINARFSDLLSGGKPLIILLVLTLGFIVIQDIVGVLGAMLTGQPLAVGILSGSASLIGGHGTAIGIAPQIAESNGVPNALEIGVSAATLGLVLASLMGGPISKFLLKKYSLKSESESELLVGVSHEDKETEQITHLNLMGVILAIHICIILGYFLNQLIASAGLVLPLFVSCLLVAIILSNFIPGLLPRLNWPARTRALAVVSDFSLGLFIAMSLMGMQLWSIASLAGPLMIILLLQVVAAVSFILLILFPLMGKNYLAAVLSAGFAGFSLGATPTAIANMTAVTKAHGPAPTAFVILPLVGAFFVDITNAFVIQFFLGRIG